MTDAHDLALVGHFLDRGRCRIDRCSLLGRVALLAVRAAHGDQLSDCAKPAVGRRTTNNAATMAPRSRRARTSNLASPRTCCNPAELRPCNRRTAIEIQQQPPARVACCRLLGFRNEVAPRNGRQRASQLPSHLAFPTLRCGVVAVARVDPAASRRRRPPPSSRRERGSSDSPSGTLRPRRPPGGAREAATTSTMLSPGRQLAHAMHDERSPAAASARCASASTRSDLRFRHAGIVLERHARDRLARRRRRARAPVKVTTAPMSVRPARQALPPPRRRRSPPSARARPWLSLRSPAGRRRSRARRRSRRRGFTCVRSSGDAHHLRRARRPQRTRGRGPSARRPGRHTVATLAGQVDASPRPCRSSRAPRRNRGVFADMTASTRVSARSPCGSPP